MPQQFVARFLEAETVMPANVIMRLAVPASVAAAATPRFARRNAGQVRAGAVSNRRIDGLKAAGGTRDIERGSGFRRPGGEALP